MTPDGLSERLRRAGIVEVDAGARRRAEYASDASNYRVVPRAVVFPRDADEVLAALEVCRAEGVALTARGAGTSIAGNAVGGGVVLDFSRHMNRVLSVDPDHRTAVVQPGVVLDALTAAAAPYGLRFGPDPSTHARATIGGALGNNACGARALAYGRASDNTVELDVVTGSGVRFTARRYGREGLHEAGTGGPAHGDPGGPGWDGPASGRGGPERGGPGGPGSDGPASGRGGPERGGPGGPGSGGPGSGGPGPAGPGPARGGRPHAGPEAALATALDTLIRTRLPLIRTEFGRFTRQVSGYSLEHLLPENGADLAKFLVGTEGTLAVLLQATVRLVEAPEHTALAVLGYPDMAAAADAVPGLLPHRPVALEGMSARLVDVVRTRRGQAAVPDVLPAGEGWIFAETTGHTQAEAMAAARALARDADCGDSAVVAGPAARALWRIREDGAGLGGRTPAGAPAWPGWEDSAVPPERLGVYTRQLTDLMREFGLDGLMYGHFGDGCLHVRIDFPLAERPAHFAEFLDQAAALAGRHGGSVSGEHGDGRARGALLHHMYSPEALDTFAAVKDLFDPQDVLNPGIIVRPRPVDADLRLPAARPVPGPLAFAYPHDRGDLTAAVHRCVGIGKCRADTTGSGGVMCPSFLATRDEKDSTRGRARVLQELANGTLVDGGWRSPQIAESLDLCLACKGCASDCPAGVDMATYKAEALYQRYRGRLRPASHYALGQLPRWARLSAPFARLLNAVLARPSVAALAQRVAGLDPRRPLPRLAVPTFRRWFGARRKPTGPRPGDHGPVLLWVDTFTDHFTPAVGEAAAEVLEAAGYDVRITGSAVCCGLTWISTGQLDGAKRQLSRTLDALEPALEGGWPIVGLEPSCTAVLRADLTELLPDDPRAARVAAATRTLAELLTATPGWTPPDLTGVRAVAQPHCHHHAVLGWDTDARLLREAGAEVEAVGGCCGLAGNFGVEKGHYEVSVAVAGNALLPAVRAAAPDTQVLADGFSCRTQLEHLTDRTGRHLAELLADGLDVNTAPRTDPNTP